MPSTFENTDPTNGGMDDGLFIQKHQVLNNRSLDSGPTWVEMQTSELYIVPVSVS